ncbi:unnamed protein product [Arabis nemorensis]|uniref:Clathrin/coatomer adaptor adaptin-like N-terminal domain-containing protein n=1 Tax=Arabis nemorensis TaxID=586526 RepID=A0A565AYI2_9BRAS|nr:unnamed protein product [Arabis nemorensis]
MEKSCTLLIYYDKGTPAIANEIMYAALRGNDIPAKIDALKKAVMLLLNGETLPQLYITLLRYFLTSEDHTVQKLLLLYLETIEKTDDAKGRILPEMILICQNLTNNLRVHPWSYLSRLRVTQVMEPLIPNAILAIMSIFKHQQGDQLFLVDAPETIEKSEQDPSAKRNAFLMLFNCGQDREQKVYRTKASEKEKYLKIIISLFRYDSARNLFLCRLLPPPSE